MYDKKITVKLGEVDVPNKSGFIIPKNIMQKAINDHDKKPIFGTLGNPDGGVVSLYNVTHWIDNARIEGNAILGEINFIGSVDHNPAMGIIEAMDEIICSPRGYGNVVNRDDGVMIVQDDYTLCGFDIVYPR